MESYFLILAIVISVFAFTNGDDTSIPEIIPTYTVGRIFLDDAGPLQSGSVARSEFRLPNNNGLLNALLRETTLEQLYRRPVFVVTKSLSSPYHLDVAFASSGIQTVLTDPSFAYIRNFLQSHDPKSAVIFDFSSFFNARLLNHKVGQFVFPNDFHFADFTKLVTASRLIPVVAIFRRAEFEELRFDHIYQLGNLAVHQEFIEPIVTVEAPLNPLPVDTLPVNPSHENPSFVNPSAANPTHENPSFVNPSSVNPSAVNPSPVNPSHENPLPVNPSHENPSPVNPSHENPSFVNPSPVNPFPVNPTPENPTPLNPSHENPSLVNP